MLSFTSPYDRPSGTEHSLTVRRVIAGRHHDRIPRRVHQLHDQSQQRVAPRRGQTAELDQGAALEPDR